MWRSSCSPRYSSTGKGAGSSPSRSSRRPAAAIDAVSSKLMFASARTSIGYVARSRPRQAPERRDEGTARVAAKRPGPIRIDDVEDEARLVGTWRAFVAGVGRGTCEIGGEAPERRGRLSRDRDRARWRRRRSGPRRAGSLGKCRHRARDSPCGSA